MSASHEPARRKLAFRTFGWEYDVTSSRTDSALHACVERRVLAGACRQAQERTTGDLPERSKRPPVNDVVGVRVRVHLLHGGADVPPVHLWKVVVRTAWPQKDRVREVGVLVHVRKRGEPQRVVRAYI